MNKASILIFDNSKKKNFQVKDLLKKHENLIIHTCDDFETAHQLLQHNSIDILILDPLSKNDHPQTDLEILQMCNVLEKTKVIGIVKSITKTMYQKTNKNKIDDVITFPLNEKKLFNTLNKFIHLIQI